jgi:hypothetical protein
MGYRWMGSEVTEREQRTPPAGSHALFDDDSTVTDHNMVKTCSKVRSWWLAKFGGYRVVRVQRAPMQGMFGRISYKSTYFLQRAA